VVNRIITDLGVFDVTPDGLKGVELAPGVTAEEIRIKTGCHVHLSHLAIAA
jgi:3-oxoacid CoA-transferase subunit B